MLNTLQVEIVMIKEPFFSVIIPTYNRAAFVVNAIQSVINQVFSDWELIVVDDGSTDHTKEVVTVLNDERIRYVYQQNAERSAARNNGIRHARGKFICFLDSDDVYLPNHLECFYKLISEKNEAEAMYVANVARNEFGKIVEVPFENAADYRNAVCFFLAAGESIIPARVCIHKSIWNDFEFDESLKDVEDMVLWVQIVAKYPLFQTPDSTSIYFIHRYNSTNLINNPYGNQLIGLKKIFRDPALNKMIPSSVRKQKLSRCYQGIAEFNFYQKDYSQMMRNLITSIFCNPSSPSTRVKLRMMGAGFAYALGLKR